MKKIIISVLIVFMLILIVACNSERAQLKKELKELGADQEYIDAVDQATDQEVKEALAQVTTNKLNKQNTGNTSPEPEQNQEQADLGGNLQPPALPDE